MIFEKIPLAAIIDTAIYLNTEQKSMDEIKAETGCTHILNGGYYDLETRIPMNHLIVNGKLLSKSLGKNGLSLDGKKVCISYDNQVGYRNHVSGYPTLVASGKAQTNFPKELIPAAQRTVAGLTKDALIVGVFCTPIKLTEVPDIMISMECIYGVNLDGSRSSKCDFNGERYEATDRRVHNYILIWADTSKTVTIKPNQTQTQPQVDDGLNLSQDFISSGRKNRPGKANPMEYITVHDTGNVNTGAGALNHAKYLKGDSAANAKVSYHYTVDDTRVVQHLPDNETAYHAGDGPNGPGNATSIGVEICINSDGNLTAATDRAARLVAVKCKEHNIPIENVVQHNHWNGKDCPKLIRSGKPYSWDTFILKVKKYMESPAETTPKADEPASWAKEAWGSAKAQGILDGMRPTDPVSRQEMAVILDRLGLI